ncbi:MAG: hypothetical protein ABI954_15760 [Pyrinomonadaceae bacterium]
MEPSRSRVGRYFSYVSIKTDDAGGAREFMLLSTDYEHIHDPGLFGPTLHGPFTKGDAGEGCYMSSAVGGGTLNRDFVWKCTSIV